MDEPRTKAGRYFLELLPGFRIDHVSDGKLALMHVLAIEREAAAPQPLDVERLRIAYEAGRAAASFEAALARVNAVVSTDTSQLAATLAFEEPRP